MKEYMRIYVLGMFVGAISYETLESLGKAIALALIGGFMAAAGKWIFDFFIACIGQRTLRPKINKSKKLNEKTSE